LFFCPFQGNYDTCPKAVKKELGSNTSFLDEILPILTERNNSCVVPPNLVQWHATRNTSSTGEKMLVGSSEEESSTYVIEIGRL